MRLFGEVHAVENKIHQTKKKYCYHKVVPLELIQNRGGITFW